MPRVASGSWDLLGAGAVAVSMVLGPALTVRTVPLWFKMEGRLRPRSQERLIRDNCYNRARLG